MKEMIKIDYNFSAKTPLHTGSDENMGTLKSLRRQKFSVEKKQIKSKLNHKERVEAIVEILIAVHKSIDFDKIKGKRLMGIWEEWHSKLLAAATTSDKYKFFDKLSKSWGIRHVRGYDKIIIAMENICDEEILQTIREESSYVIIKLIERSKKTDADAPLFNFAFKKDEELFDFESKSVEIPCISGNSIRGVMRRLAMSDFINTCNIKKMSKSDYHMLFTGGSINQGTIYENIDLRNEMFDNCPMLYVFGSAIGNMTIDGSMSVSFAYPICKEMDNGGESFWENLDIIFQTRRDDSKQENQIKLDTDASDAPQQMKYEYEVFIPGTEFTHAFRMREGNDMAVSAFWRTMKLFKENPYVGGMFATGSSEIDLSELKIEGNDRMYVEYLKEKEETIKEYWENKK